MHNRTTIQLKFVLRDKYECVTEGRFHGWILADFLDYLGIFASDNIEYFLAESKGYQIKVRYFGATCNVYIWKGGVI